MKTLVDDGFEEDSMTKTNKTLPLDPYKQYVNDIVGVVLLEQTQALQYSRLARNGERNARRIMIESNLRLVVKIAQKYEHKRENLLEFSDTYQLTEERIR